MAVEFLCSDVMFARVMFDVHVVPSTVWFSRRHWRRFNDDLQCFVGAAGRRLQQMENGTIAETKANTENSIGYKLYKAQFEIVCLEERSSWA